MVAHRNAEALARRTVQPGHVRDFRVSEVAFTAFVCAHLRQMLAATATRVEEIIESRGCATVVTYLLDGVPTWRVSEHPSNLRAFFGRSPEGRDWGLVPELAVENLLTGRPFFFEVKQQGDRGNAEERAGKLFTRKLSVELRTYLEIDYHPFMVVFYGALATNPRYTQKFERLYYPEEYILMADLLHVTASAN